MFSKIFN